VACRIKASSFDAPAGWLLWRNWEQSIGGGHVLIGCQVGRKAEWTVSSSTRRLEGPA
jgi:hypothetical protein